MPSTDAFPWGPALVLLAAFVLVTGGLIALAWWRRWRFSLKWLFVYTAIWAAVIPAVDHFWIRPRTWQAGVGTSGLMYWGLVVPADREDLIELITSDQFKLDCARHMAPRETLQRLLKMPHQWRLERHEQTGQYDGVQFEMGGLTPAEEKLMGRWLNAWTSETYHVAVVLYLLHNDKARLRIDQIAPLWMTGGSTGDSNSFDYPPRTPFVRHGMLQLLSEHPDRGIRAYCRRQLLAARSLDERVGFAPDPLLEEKNLVQAERPQ